MRRKRLKHLHPIIQPLAPVDTRTSTRHIQNLKPTPVVDHRQAKALQVQQKLIAPYLLKPDHFVIQLPEPVNEHQHLLKAVQKRQTVRVPRQCHLELVRGLNGVNIVNLISADAACPRQLPTTSRILPSLQEILLWHQENLVRFVRLPHTQRLIPQTVDNKDWRVAVTVRTHDCAHDLFGGHALDEHSLGVDVVPECENSGVFLVVPERLAEFTGGERVVVLCEPGYEADGVVSVGREVGGPEGRDGVGRQGEAGLAALVELGDFDDVEG